MLRPQQLKPNVKWMLMEMDGRLVMADAMSVEEDKDGTSRTGCAKHDDIHSTQNEEQIREIFCEKTRELAKLMM